MRLQMGAITLSNSKTLAFYNVQDGEEVSFELREVKGGKEAVISGSFCTKAPGVTAQPFGL